MKEKTYAARTETTTSRPGSARGRTAGAGRPSASAGRDQLAHRAADVGVQVIPHHDERSAELLVRGVQEPGVVRLGEAFALVAARARCVHPVDQPGLVTVLDGDQRGQRSRACCCRRSPSPPGSARGGPRYGPSAALSPGLIHPRSRSRRPGPPPSFYHGPGLLPPSGDRRLVPLGGPPRRDLHAPPDPVQQHIHPGQRVLHPEPPPDLLADPGQRPALIRMPAPRRAGIQHRLQLGDLAHTACTGHRLLLWRPAPPGRPQPGPVATGSPTSGSPAAATPPPGHWPRPRSARPQLT